jgi:hypothetical protein
VTALPSTLKVAIHPLFEDYGADLEEISSCLIKFVNGDSGNFANEDEILGFLARDLEGKTRHGVYETTSAGRTHVIGDRVDLVVLPDIAFAQIDKGSECSINTCTCSEKKTNRNKKSCKSNINPQPKK